MKVLVDSSAWIDFLNGAATREADAVAALLGGDGVPCLCGVVAAEVLQGLGSERSFEEVAAMFAELDLVEPAGLSTYRKAAELYRALRARGVTVRSTIDCLIVALAEEQGCRLLARDRDLQAIVASGLTAVRFA